MLLFKAGRLLTTAHSYAGSGKTHTMGTSEVGSAAEEEEWGITPRVIRSFLLLCLIQ